MSTLVIDGLQEAEKFVKVQRHRGNDVRWDGWTIVFFKPTHHGFRDIKGAFRRGRWGVEIKVPVNDDGTWRVQSKYVRKPAR